MLDTLPLFGDLERFLADLYPYRYVITPLLALVGIGIVVLALRRGVHLVLWRHRLATAVVGAPLLVLAVVAGDYLLSPLWERSYLEEASPLARTVDAPRESLLMSSEAPGGPAVALQGMFRGADDFHFGRGDALIIRTEASRHLLRFENFSVRNGPDLYVYLSKDGSGGARVEESLNLGQLKATDGSFNYEIPGGVDLGGVKSVVVWCRQFGVLFAVAPLM